MSAARTCALWAVVLLVQLASAAAAAEGRWALVVGINTYRALPPLTNAVADARTIEQELERAGFEVRTVLDADRKTLFRELIEFARRVEGGGEAVFFYAGHGIQIENVNYLLPADFSAMDLALVPFEAVSLNEVSNQLREAKTRFSLLVIDACRNNPLPRVAARGISRAAGLAAMSAATGQMIVFSAGAGQEALDSLGPADTEVNSLFVREFVKAMRLPGLSVREILDRTKLAVEERAASVNHVQRPAVYDESRGKFFFYPPQTAVSDAPAPDAPSVAKTAEQIEDELWERILERGSREGFEGYLRLYPNGRYVRAAQLELFLMQAPDPVASTAAEPAEQAIGTENTALQEEADTVGSTAADSGDAGLDPEPPSGQLAGSDQAVVEQAPKVPGNEGAAPAPLPEPAQERPGNGGSTQAASASPDAVPESASGQRAASEHAGFQDSRPDSEKLALAQPSRREAAQGGDPAPLDLAATVPPVAIGDRAIRLGSRAIALPAGDWELQRIDRVTSYAVSAGGGEHRALGVSALITGTLSGSPVAIVFEATDAERWRPLPERNLGGGTYWADQLCEAGPNRGALLFEFNSDYDNPECLSVHTLARVPSAVPPSVVARLALAERAGTGQDGYLVWYARFFHAEYMRLFLLLPKDALGEAQAVLSWARALSAALGPVAQFRSTLAHVPALESVARQP